MKNKTASEENKHLCVCVFFNNYTCIMFGFTLDPGSTCPTTFTLNPSVNLCYHVVEITMLWLDARGHCEAMGARLAVLDTPGKLDAIFNGLFLFTNNH